MATQDATSEAEEAVEAQASEGTGGGRLAAGAYRLRGVRALAVVLIIFGGLWLVTSTKDLPSIHHPDEPTNLRVIDRMVADHDLNPRYFTYPSLFFDVQAAVDLEGPFVGWLGRQEVAPSTLVIGTSKTTTPGSVKVHRAVTVLFGLLTVAAVYAATCELTKRREAALVAAVVMATSVTLGVNARYITPDVMATALVAGTLWASVRLWQKPTWGSHLAAGAMAGLAASAKYNAVLVVVTVVAAAVLSPGWRDRGVQRAMQLGASGLAAGASFLLTTPYALLDHHAFLDGVAFQRDHYATGHAGMDGDAARWYAHYLVSAETLLVIVALLGTSIALAAKRWRALLLLWTFPLIYGVFVASQAVRNDRTILPLLPNLAAVAGFGSALLLERFAPEGLNWRTLPVNATAVGVVAGVAVLGAQTGRVVDALGLGQETTWATSQNWIEDNVPAGSSIYIEGYSPWIDPVDYDVTATTYIAGAPGLLDRDYIVVSDQAYHPIISEPDRFPTQTRAYRQLFEQTRTVARFEGNGPTIQVLQPRT